MPLDLDPIRSRHAALDRRAWRDRIKANEEFDESVDEFMSNADDDIFALLAEVDRLSVENEGLHAELKTAQSDLACFKEDLRHVQVTLDQLRYRIERRDIY